MRVGALVQGVVVHQHRLAQRAGLAVAEGPFAPVAVGRGDIAVEVDAAVDAAHVRARAVHHVEVPERHVARLQRQRHGLFRGDADAPQVVRRHVPLHHPAVAVERYLAPAMAARAEHHRAVVGPVRVDRDRGLDIGGRRVAVGGARPAEPDVLVEAEAVLGRARRLPVHLVDDLLHVAADQRPDDLEDPGVGPVAVEHRVGVGRPLHHAQRLAEIGVLGQAEQQVAVAEAAPQAEARGADRVEGGGDLGYLGRAEDPADDGEAVAPVVLQVVFAVAGHRLARDGSLPFRF